MFTGKPIPFAKLGGMFANTKLGQFLSSIKKDAKRISDSVKATFAKNFINPLREKLNSFDRWASTPFNDLNAELENLTANNYLGLERSLNLLFSNNASSVVNARNTLLERLGKVVEFSANTNYKLGPFSIGELSSFAAADDSFAATLRDMEQHTDNLSGLGGATVKFDFQRIYGNVTVQNTAVHIVSSNVVYPNLSKTIYPVVNIGDIIVVENEERVVISKKFTPTFDGTVSIDTTTNNVKVTTASVSTLNLASCNLSVNGGIGVLETGNILLNSGMFISVNGEVRQINTINSLGDYLTVYLPFNNSVSNTLLLRESSFNVNTAFTFTNERLLQVRNSFIANSLCLDNVITGVGTTFTSVLQANNKIYYDNKEYNVVAVTNTTITVDDSLRYTERFPVYKINNETPFLDLTEDMVDPDGIITAFTLPGQIMGDNAVLNDLTVRVRRANGVYQTVSASKPVDAAQSLFQEELLRKAKDILTQMKYDLRDDAIRSLSEAQLVAKIEETYTRITNIKSDIKNVIEQDMAVINQVKSLVKGMIKLFSMSCSKKKRKDEGGKATDSDDYLDLILQPNPDRQGCDATSSDFITILDDFDKEYNDPNLDTPNIPDIDTGIPSANNLFDGLDSISGPFPRQDEAPDGGNIIGGGIDDQNPDVEIPEDPCAKPC
jgi:hypothetical protein